MKPLSNTDTTASARGFSSPLTLIRIEAFRGSDTSCIDLAIASVLPLLARTLHRPDEQPAHLRPAVPGFVLDAGDDILDIAGADVVVEIDVHHHSDLVRR